MRALHVLAKRKPHENNRNEKEPTPGSARFSANRIREVFINRCECLEDDRFHSVPIFASLPGFWEYAELRTEFYCPYSGRLLTERRCIPLLFPISAL